MMRHSFTVASWIALTVALALGSAGSASAQTFPLLRTVAAPTFTPQASFYNPVRDELVVIAFEGDRAQIYDADGDLVRASSPLPTPFGMSVDGAAYDLVGGVGLVVRHNCELIELDPVALTIRSRRMLGGSATIPAPTLCTGVDVGSDGLLYVSDYNSPRVLVYPRAVSTEPVRSFSVAITLTDNLARAPGTDLIMVATNSSGTFAMYRESGALVAGPAPLGMDIILGAHTRTNTAGSDGLTFIGTSGRLWFCDHNDPVASCYLQTRGCTGAADCPLPFIGCDVPTGLCLSATCGDGNIEGGEACDDGDTMGGDGCSAGCVVEPGFTCTGEPSVCDVCRDTSAMGTDTGCSAATPHCRTTGLGSPSCETCIDDSMGGGTDLGCTGGAPRCVRNLAGDFTCIGCSADADCADTNDCTIDSCSIGACMRTSAARGATCSTGVCSGAGSDLCVECIDDTQCGAGERCNTTTSTCDFIPDAFMSLPDAFVPEADAFVPEPDAFVPEGVDAGPRPDAARPDAATAPIDAAATDIDAGAPTGGSFVGGAVCSASHSRTGSALTWGLLAMVLSTLIVRRRAR